MHRKIETFFVSFSFFCRRVCVCVWVRLLNTFLWEKKYLYPTFICDLNYEENIDRGSMIYVILPISMSHPSRR